MTDVQNFYISYFNNWEFQFACFGEPISYLEIQKKQIRTLIVNIEVLDISTLFLTLLAEKPKK